MKFRCGGELAVGVFQRRRTAIPLFIGDVETWCPADPKARFHYRFVWTKSAKIVDYPAVLITLTYGVPA